MPIKTKLNQAWQANEAVDAVFELRAQTENVYNVLEETVARIDEIVASEEFEDVDAEIKAKANAIKGILQGVINSLKNHLDFINWRKPE